MHAEILTYPYYVCFIKTFDKNNHVMILHKTCFQGVKRQGRSVLCKTLCSVVSYIPVQISTNFTSTIAFLLTFEV